MGRVINTKSGSRQRNHSLRMIALAVRTLATQNHTESTLLDIGAFLLLQLRIISQTVDQAATAWEKRNYWVKADTFRRQWRWVDSLESSLSEALSLRDWQKMSETTAVLAGKISGGKAPKRIPRIPPWKDAAKTVSLNTRSMEK